MPLRLARGLVTGLKAAGLALLGALVLLLLVIQASNWTARLRDERLLADYHALAQEPGTWADAQRLMAKWGRWGHYEGRCSVQYCEYSVGVTDPLWLLREVRPLAGHYGAMRLIYTPLDRLGWHASRGYFEFVVRQGSVQATAIGLGVDAMKTSRDEKGHTHRYDYGLGVDARLHNRMRQPTLRHSRYEEWSGVGRDTPQDNPDLEVERPGGCMFCEIADVSYSRQLAWPELLRMTSFALSCMTRVLHPCKDPGDLLPAVANRHLYEDNEDDKGADWSPETACRVPPRALGRDADMILQATALSATSEKEQYENTPHAVTNFRVSRMVKGGPIASPGEIIRVRVSAAMGANVVLFLPNLTDRPPIPGMLREGVNHTDLCGVLPNTPEVMQQIELGISQDVPIYRPRPEGN